MVKGILDLLIMIPKGGKYAKSVVNFVHKVPKNWVKFKSEIEMVLNLLKGGKLRLVQGCSHPPGCPPGVPELPVLL